MPRINLPKFSQHNNNHLFDANDARSGQSRGHSRSFHPYFKTSIVKYQSYSFQSLFIFYNDFWLVERLRTPSSKHHFEKLPQPNKIKNIKKYLSLYKAEKYGRFYTSMSLTRRAIIAIVLMSFVFLIGYSIFAESDMISHRVVAVRSLFDEKPWKCFYTATIICI